jgi:hypothetical protein
MPPVRIEVDILLLSPVSCHEACGGEETFVNVMIARFTVRAWTGDTNV